jgi:hypothetical protein
LFPLITHAWNGAGHRLTASIAWQQISPAHQDLIDAALKRHPDYERWVKAAKSESPAEIFAEASTWPDDIRNDPRFYSAGQEPETPALPGFPDTKRHKNWHYVDLSSDGKVHSGELDRQIERLSQVLRWTAEKEQISYALPWLIHLVGDLHQPLHVGRHGLWSLKRFINRPSKSPISASLPPAIVSAGCSIIFSNSAFHVKRPKITP